MANKCTATFNQYYAWLARATDLEKKIEEYNGKDALSVSKRKRFKVKLKEIEEKIEEYENSYG